ncbi:Na+/H+ antiporter NhaA [Terrimonas sp.]|uniref:Na+/H+ antiporter NhaA n=1 Tax=Terrimonas sp. TaxID=1914338 RepID=UPI000D51444E|nr:Na+/H+ antiporter NhaA [Terrimonas sp.]PVD53049.1 Na+/H+ antiporter NhaA [Terrimonas sp.]
MAKNLITRILINPWQRVINDSRSVGIILFAGSAVSMVLANTDISDAYLGFWNQAFHLPGYLHLPHALLHWINDGLMAVFFFLVGMEIKRELLAGELSSVKKSLLPIFAAVGGMIAPAVIYLLFNKATNYEHGWGIPMATDIAFSLGVASMLGKKMPSALKIFLMALAIIDDLGAILVIAFFYGSAVQWIYLLTGIAITIVLISLPKLKISFGWWNYVLGILLWYCMYNSGVHATIAGVIFAFTIPLSQLEKMQHSLHVPVNFIILPIFAIANTAIVIPDNITHAFTSTLSYGIILGLMLGKPLGIVLACRMLVRLKWGELPAGVNWRQLTGVGILAGIGFTMSIFIAMLAFNEPAIQDMAKVGVLAGSVLSMVIGYVWLRFTSAEKQS